MLYDHRFTHIFHHPHKNPVPTEHQVPILLQPLVAAIVSSMNLAALGTSCPWNQAVGGLMRLAYVT